jgi:glycosyltransferase involved in cell wall biosynthesis
MTEPLGQAQVLPYLIGVSRRGVEVEIVSFEGVATTPDMIRTERARLEREGIRWTPMVRSPSHSVSRKVWEIGSAALRGLASALRRRPDIVHARSYLPAATADVVAAICPGAKLLFDVRGMLAEEYVDGGHWADGSFQVRLVKRYERHLFRRSAGIVVLTEALRRIFRSERYVPDSTPIEVIPCCVDESRFRIDPRARAETRAALGLGERPVVVYSGTLGSWYKAEEMARFVGLFRRHHPDAAFLVLSQHDPSGLVAAARAEGLGERDVIVRSVPPKQMAGMLAAGDIGLSFIQPCFSKIGSSPTKVAEYLATGLGVVVNAEIGDQADLRADTDACVALPSLNHSDLEIGAVQAAAIARAPLSARARVASQVARARFSLENLGIPRYHSFYERLCAAGPVEARGGRLPGESR